MNFKFEGGICYISFKFEGGYLPIFIITQILDKKKVLNLRGIFAHEF